MADNDFTFSDIEQPTSGGASVEAGLSLPITDYVPLPPSTTSDE